MRRTGGGMAAMGVSARWLAREKVFGQSRRMFANTRRLAILTIHRDGNRLLVELPQPAQRQQRMNAAKIASSLSDARSLAKAAK